MPKPALRERQLAHRRALSLEEGLRRSYAAQERLAGSDVFRRARALALYSPIAGEVHTESLFRQAVAAAKLVAYPRVENDRLAFVPVETLQSMRRGGFGILEPEPGEPLPLAALDLVVLPGVAFDLEGHRLGYGKGYYDRTFAARPDAVLLVGFCYEFQVVRQLPAEEHDVRMDLIVTDTRLIRCGDRISPVNHNPPRGGNR